MHTANTTHPTRPHETQRSPRVIRGPTPRDSMNTSPPDIPQDENDSKDGTPENLETMGGRLEYAIYHAGLKKGELARILDVARQTVTRWVGGDDIPEEKLDRIALVTGRPKSWFRYNLTGDPSKGGQFDEGFGAAQKLALDMVGELHERLRELEPPAGK